MEDVVSSILDAMWAMGLESSDEESAKKSPGDKSGEDKPDNKDDKAKPSSGSSRDVCPSDWIFKGFTSFMIFGPFKENFEAKRVLSVFNPKDPPPEEKKENSQSSARKRAPTQEKP